MAEKHNVTLAVVGLRDQQTVRAPAGFPVVVGPEDQQRLKLWEDQQRLEA